MRSKHFPLQRLTEALSLQLIFCSLQICLKNKNLKDTHYLNPLDDYFTCYHAKNSAI